MQFNNLPFPTKFTCKQYIAIKQVVPLDWWPLTRDCLAYGFTVSVLICIIHDERVEWYEALILVLLYIVYIGVMYFDKTIQKWAKGKYYIVYNGVANIN